MRTSDRSIASIVPAKRKATGAAFFRISFGVLCLIAWTLSPETADAKNAGEAYLFSTFAGAASVEQDNTVVHALSLRAPAGVAVDDSGNIYIADTDHHVIRKIASTGAATVLAGSVGQPGSADGPGRVARFYYPKGVAVDEAGNVFVADTANHTVRKIGGDGLVTTVAGLAGSIGQADGAESVARFYYPYGVATDDEGNVYVADTFNNTIRLISPRGVVRTLAGLAGNVGSLDGNGSAARFNHPSALTVDSTSQIYVADAGNAAVRRVTTDGNVSTLAGLPGRVGSADGVGSGARFRYPSGVAADADGNVFVADTANQTIRKINLAGVFS